METKNRLGQYLAIWEEKMWRWSVIAKIQQLSEASMDYPLRGSVLNFRELRSRLLRTIEAREFDHRMFLDGLSEIRHPTGKVEFLFPSQLAAWTMHSRRIYHLTEDLHLLLQATSLRGLRWKDIPWVFDSFGISMEKPVRSNDQEREFDFALVSKPGLSLDLDETVVVPDNRFMSFFQEYKWKPMDLVLKRKVNEAIAKNSPLRAAHFFKKLSEASRQSYAMAIVPGEVVADELIEEVEGLEETDYGRMLRVVVGLMFFLSNKPPIEVIRGGGKATGLTKSTVDLSAITDPFEVCKVDYVTKLTAEERELFRERFSRLRGHELRAHFRSGYWKRPNGKGGDPTAEKTVHVRPTIVRRDRLPENGLPGGAIQIPQK